MDAIRERRKRARSMREQKKEEMFLQELANGPILEKFESNVMSDEMNKESNIKRLRMQNAKGTSGMFIKP